MNAQDKAESLRLIELIEPETCAMTDDGSGDFIFCIDALRNIIELQDGEDMATRGAAQYKEDAERYRWLREQEGWPESEAAMSGISPIDFDSVIDKARKS